MVRVGDFDDKRLDHGEVQAGRHAIVEQPGVPQNAVLVVKVFLAQGPADALGYRSLHLAFDVTRMKGTADILDDRASENTDLSGFGVDFDVHAHGGEGVSHRADGTGIERRAAYYRSAGTGESG